MTIIAPPFPLSPTPRVRATWDEYFMAIAQVVATRATCDRKHVGCVLVTNKHLIATGYNGAIAGLPNCDDIGHLMEDGHCIRTVHAEMNAVAQAAHHGISVKAATAYVTASPCWPCFKVLANAGINRIVFQEFYRDAKIFDAAKELGIELVGETGQ
jgi:dCMP deaminase